ncbi:MAG: hypothetical protein WDZ49_13720, partial [Litorilinea sp.]
MNLSTNMGSSWARALLLAVLIGMGGLVALAAHPVHAQTPDLHAPQNPTDLSLTEVISEVVELPMSPDPGTVIPIPDLWDVELYPAGEELAPPEIVGAQAEPEPTADDLVGDDLAGIAGVAQIPAPYLLAPQTGDFITGATDPPTGVPTLQWEAVLNADRYQVQISVSPGFAVTLVSQETYALSYTPTSALADGTYYWRVRARAGRNYGEYSETWSFTKDWSSDQALRPLLLAPADSSEISRFEHEHFSWEPIPGAASYRLEIAADSEFNQIVYDDTTIKPHHTPDQRLGNSQYYWRVAPLDTKGNRGAASDVWGFTFLWDTPPDLLAPEDNLETPFIPQFSWAPVEGARRYQLEISTQNDLTNANVYLTANTDFTPEKALSNDEDYYWRVKAIDANNVGTRYSEIRSFSMRWNIQPQLLTPANNAIMLSFPYFTWTPVPEAERYEIQIATDNGFQSPLGKAEVYNVTAYTQASWREAGLMSDFYWRVRGIDAQKNFTPWSDVFSFQINTLTGPSPIYPHYYYAPDTENLPVHEDRTLAWPVFVWNSSYDHALDGAPARNQPDYYHLIVSEALDFSVINFEIDTAGLAAAPTLENPFTGLEDGKLYYWRVRAMRNDLQMGVDRTWPMRYDAGANRYEVVDEMRIMHPVVGKEAVEVAPVLGWLPVEGAHHYRVQLSHDRDFTEIVDEAQPQFIYYVPWQARHAEIPQGTYWWRVRAEDATGGAVTEWSETRYFNLSQEGVMGNPYDFRVPPAGLMQIDPDYNYNPELTRLAVNATPPVNPDHALGALHMLPDRSHLLVGQPSANYTWITAFEVAQTISETVQYGIYIDADHNPESGAIVDPLGKPIGVDPLYKTDYAVYVTRTPANELSAALYRWLGTTWSPGVIIDQMGGAVWFDDVSDALHVRMPYSSLGSTTDQFVGSLAVTVFSSTPGAASGMLASVPTQPGPDITRPALISDMLMPLFPFDTPLWNPRIHHEAPTLHWRIPYFNSVDGYEVQVALDDRFTQMVETWETYETGNGSFFALLPAAHQSKIAYSDNESYFWRVRMRYERHTSRSTNYERSSWSRPMRYKLTSYTVGNPLARSNARVEDIPGGDSTADLMAAQLGISTTLTDTVTDPVTDTVTETLVVQTSPTFSWERIEGAAGYRLWVSQDANFSKRIIDKQLDSISYTPQDALPDGTYYWMVAPRRSSRVFGQWSPVYTFVKVSGAPTPLGPVEDEVVNGHPTFTWEPLYSNTLDLRMATSRYRLQISDDVNFSSPTVFDTQSTSFTLSKGNAMRRTKLSDGTWYWRVAAIDANGNAGTYSAIQQFRKEYLRPVLISPAQGESETD